MQVINTCQRGYVSNASMCQRRSCDALKLKCELDTRSKWVLEVDSLNRIYNETPAATPTSAQESEAGSRAWQHSDRAYILSMSHAPDSLANGLSLSLSKWNQHSSHKPYVSGMLMNSSPARRGPLTASNWINWHDVVARTQTSEGKLGEEVADP